MSRFHAMVSGRDAASGRSHRGPILAWATVALLAALLPSAPSALSAVSGLDAAGAFSLSTPAASSATPPGLEGTASRAAPMPRGAALASLDAGRPGPDERLRADGARTPRAPLARWALLRGTSTSLP